MQTYDISRHAFLWERHGIAKEKTLKHMQTLYTYVKIIRHAIYKTLLYFPFMMNFENQNISKHCWNMKK